MELLILIGCVIVGAPLGHFVARVIGVGFASRSVTEFISGWQR